MRTASPTTNGARLRVAVNVDVDPRDHDELLRKAESYATWGVLTSARMEDRARSTDPVPRTDWDPAPEEARLRRAEARS